MKITKQQLRRIIKEEISRNILIEKKKKKNKKKKKKPKKHPYDKAASKWYDRSESNTDVADQIFIDVEEELGPDHPLTLRIEQLIDDQDDDFEDLLDEIQQAATDGSAPADLKDRLHARDSM